MISGLYIRRCTILRLSSVRSRRPYSVDSKSFKEGDIVLLRPSKEPTRLKDAREAILTKPLGPSHIIQTPGGAIRHSAIIGLRLRDPVTTAKGIEYRVHEPSLAEYVCLCPRVVTPIYPAHTNLIVSLLDLHPSPPCGGDESNEGRLEILEAGTGHGALTLHLARAIHCANPPVPVHAMVTLPAPEISGQNETPVEAAKPITREEITEMQNWRAGRRAVVHTVDISEKHSNHARKVVKNFRHGLYYNDVEFHVGDIPDFFASRKSSLQQFLSHVILDMPSPSSDNRLSLVSQHLQIDGKLLVFNPSVTQIVDCMQTIKEQRLPLVLESVLELGGGTLGGREWDVRTAKIKSAQRELAASEAVIPGFWDSLMGRLWKTKRQNIPESKAQKDWAVVCRPKFNDRVVNGGFLGVWRRMREKEG